MIPKRANVNQFWYTIFSAEILWICLSQRFVRVKKKIKFPFLLCFSEKTLINHFIDDKRKTQSNQSFHTTKSNGVSSIVLPAHSIKNFHERTSLRSIKYLPKLSDAPFRQSKVNLLHIIRERGRVRDKGNVVKIVIRVRSIH